jgi:pimeloyl-ACP methyl ester carboxylesterase
MNFNRALPAFFCLLILFSCKPKKHSENKTETSSASATVIEHFDNGKIYPSVNVSAHPDESFALYLPLQYKRGGQYPALLLFDPHGDGNFAVSKYQLLAEEFGFMLVGSNTAKNGMTLDETNRIADNLITETSSRFQIEKGLISIVGFSGGARTALVVALAHPELCAVVYCGAAMPSQQIKQLPPALGIAGRSDMNYTEVLGFDAALSEDAEHCVIEWNGKHEWPDTSVFAQAFQWCLFSAMKKNYVAQNEEAAQQFIVDNLKPLPDAKDEELRMRKIIAFTKGIADVSSMETKRNAWMNSGAYKKELAKRQEIFEIETRMKKNYAVCLEEQNLSWWQNEIARMKKLKAGTEKDMYSRLLSYISLACYSYSSSAVSQGNVEVGKKILSIYKLADPGNADRAYIEAVLYAKLGDDARVISLLQEAVGLGFKDKAKMQNEEAFAKIRDSSEFREILNKIS